MALCIHLLGTGFLKLHMEVMHDRQGAMWCLGDMYYNVLLYYHDNSNSFIITFIADGQKNVNHLLDQLVTKTSFSHGDLTMF